MKKQKITPNQWMSLYEGGKSILVLNPIDFTEDETLELVPYDSKKRKVLEGLPTLIRVVVSNQTFFKSRFNVIELAAIQ